MRRLPALVVLSLLLPASASAATVRPGSFRAAAGERNRVTITQSDGRLRYHDAGPRLRAEDGCRRIAAHTAGCPVLPGTLRVRLGGRDDTVRLRRVRRAWVDGGGGDDLLRGGNRSDRLLGGSGADRVLAAGDGRSDRVTCGRGNDEVVTERLDVVRGCETLGTPGDGLAVAVLPTADSNSVDFTAGCRTAFPPGCLGSLTVTGPAGEPYGTRQYDVAPQRAGAVVSVPLTDAGKAAIRAGAVIVVDVLAEDEARGYTVELP